MVQTIANALKRPGSTYSAVQYSSGASVLQSTTSSLPIFTSTISGNAQLGGGINVAAGTNAAAGLNLCNRLLSTQSGPRFVVLLTDQNNVTSPVTAAANALKLQGVTIVVIEVPTINPAWEEIASNPELFVNINTLNCLLSPNGPLAQSVCDKCCNRAKICYAIDESGSISGSEFDQELEVVVGITHVYSAFAPTSYFSAVGFGSTWSIPEVSTVQSLTTDVDTFVASVEGNSQSGGLTPIGPALSKCHEELKKFNACLPRIIVLLTDGYGNLGPSGTSVADMIKDDNMKIVTVGIGSSVNSGNLMEIATVPGYYVPITDFETLGAEIGTISKKICDASSNKHYKYPQIMVPRGERSDRAVAVTGVVCSSKMQLHVDSGNSNRDLEVCKIVMNDRTFCSAAGRCRQKCDSSILRECMPGKAFMGCVDGSDRASGATAPKVASYMVSQGSRPSVECKGSE